MNSPLPDRIRHIPVRGDMSSCINSVCPSSGQCWRFLKDVSKYQTYSCYTVPEGADRCASFVQVEERDWVDGPGVAAY